MAFQDLRRVWQPFLKSGRRNGAESDAPSW
jgi:hypothetical protein